MFYREVFEPDRGYRFHRGNVSLLVGALAFGRRLTNKQRRVMAGTTNDYINGLSARPPERYGPSQPLTESSFLAIKDQDFYKFVSDESLSYIQNGQFQLGNAAYYRDTPNMNIADHREGRSMFHLFHHNDELSMQLTAGFNCAIFCGTRRPIRNKKDLMKKRFGRRLIKISPITDFCGTILNIIGGLSYQIRDVVYTDTKHYLSKYAGIAELGGVIGNTGLTPEDIHAMNLRFFTDFYRIALCPSLLSKPRRYYQEAERRVIFEMPRDLPDQPYRFGNASLSRFISVED